MSLRVDGRLKQNQVAVNQIIQAIVGFCTQLFQRLSKGSIPPIHLLIRYLASESHGMPASHPTQVLVALNCVFRSAVRQATCARLVVVETGKLHGGTCEVGAVKQKQGWGVLQCGVIALAVVHAIEAELCAA